MQKRKKKLSLDNIYKLSVPVSSLFYDVEVRGVVTLVNKLILDVLCSFLEGKLGTGHWTISTQFWHFPNISSFSEILGLKLLGYSWGKLYNVCHARCQVPLYYDKWKIYYVENVEKFWNIMPKIVDITIREFTRKFVETIKRKKNVKLKVKTLQLHLIFNTLQVFFKEYRQVFSNSLLPFKKTGLINIILLKINFCI